MTTARTAPTGTGPNRRRLTTEESLAGYLPERFTEREWDAMHRATYAPLSEPVFRFQENER